MKTLIVQTAYLGDLLLSIPLLKNLRQIRSEDELVLFCRKGFGELFKSMNLVHEVIEVDKNTSGSWKDAIQGLKKYEYEWIVSPHESFRTATILWRLRAKLKLGFSSWRTSWAYNKTIRRPMEWPDALRQLSLLEDLNSQLKANFEELRERKKFLNSNTEKDLSETIPEFASMSVRSRVQAWKFSANNITLPPEFICMSPGSVWATKRWPVEKFIDLAKLRLSHGDQIVLLGSPAEADIAAKIATEAPQVQNLCGQTSLTDTLKILSQSRVLVSNDSGAQHMAAAVDTPVVSIFGPTTLELGYRAWVAPTKVAQIDLECRPCGKHGSQKCPLGTHECMRALSVDRVNSLINQIISSIS